MRNITLAELQVLIKKTRNALLTSNDIAPRAAYPYYHDHPSVPFALTVFKATLTAYRCQSSELVHALGKKRTGQFDTDFSQGTFYHALLGGFINSHFGFGDCGECTAKLAAEVILAGCGDLLFVSLGFPEAKPGMDTMHFFLSLT